MDQLLTDLTALASSTTVASYFQDKHKVYHIKLASLRIVSYFQNHLRKYKIYLVWWFFFCLTES